MAPIAAIVRSMVGRAATLAFHAGVVKSAFGGRKKGGDEESESRGFRNLPPIVQEVIREKRQSQDLLDNASNSVRGEDGSVQPAEKLTSVFDQLSKAGAGVLDWGKKLYAAFVSLPRLIEEFGATLVATRENLRQFDGGTAGAYGRLDAGRIQREAEMARDTSTSTKALVDSQNELEASRQEIREVGAKLQNLGGAVVNKLGTIANTIATAITKAAKIDKAVDILVDWWNDQKGIDKKNVDALAEGANVQIDNARKQRRLQGGGFMERLP